LHCTGDRIKSRKCGAVCQMATRFPAQIIASQKAQAVETSKYASSSEAVRETWRGSKTNTKPLPRPPGMV
jgi:hypothetical protein